MRHLCETELALFGCVGQTAHEQGLLRQRGLSVGWMGDEVRVSAVAQLKVC